MRTANEFITSNGAPPTSNAGAPLASNHTVSHVATVLGNRVSTRETATHSTERAANRARSAAAARWGELASRVIVPRWSGLVFHLRSKLGQDVGWQLSIRVGLRNIVTKLGLVVAVVDHGWVLVRDRGLMAGNRRAASGDVVMWRSMWVLASVKELGDGWVGLGAAWDLLRVSVGNTVLVNRGRRNVVGKLVTSGRGSGSRGLAGLDHVNSRSTGDILHVFRRM